MTSRERDDEHDLCCQDELIIAGLLILFKYFEEITAGRHLGEVEEMNPSCSSIIV